MMKALLFSLLAFSTLHAFPVQAQNAGAEKEIIDLENQWLKSELTNNPDLGEPLYAADYVATMGDGTLATKADAMAYARSFHWTSAKYEDVKVRVFGDAAVATGAYLASGTQDGKTSREHTRWTDTWIKASGKWVLVATQYTDVKAKPNKPST